MQADPSVAAALNATLALEITFFEVVHAYEHVFKRRKYKKLREWFDDIVSDSRGRRRYLTDRLFKLDSPASIGMGSAVVNPAEKVEAILSSTLGLAQALLASYQAGYVTAESAGDNVTADGFCDLQADVESLVGSLEAFAGQIEEVGLSVWLGEKL